MSKDRSSGDTCVILIPMGLREEKKAEQRREILDTALALFRERGYDQTRVQDIIERLRISEGTFFNYFPAKDALLHEFALDQLDLSAAALKAELARHDRSVPNRVRDLMRMWAQAWASDREFIGLVVTRSRMLSGAQGALREKELRAYDLLAGLFSEGQKRGEIRKDVKPMQLAEMLNAIFAFTAGNWLIGWWEDNSEPLEQRVIKAVDVFLDGCKPANHSSSRSATADHAQTPKPNALAQSRRRH